MRILVTGGTGVLGSQVVERLREAGHTAIVLSRRASTEADWVQGDIATGEGLEGALEGVDAVVHAASAAAEFRKIKSTDIQGTTHLVAAAEKAGVKHLVYISIVGIDMVPYVYYKAKVAAEETVKAGGVPWTILRATQFPELIDRVLRASRGPFLFVPGSMSFQPVHSSEVAQRLAELSLSSPAGMLADFGGPEVLTTKEIAHAWMARRGLSKIVVGVPIPGKAGRSFRAGNHLSPEHRDGHGTWAGWVARAYAGGAIPTAYGRRREASRDS